MSPTICTCPGCFRQITEYSNTQNINTSNTDLVEGIRIQVCEAAIRWVVEFVTPAPGVTKVRCNLKLVA